MPKYVATDLAGAWIAGKPNPGVGVPMTLTREEAEFYLRTGALREWGEPIDAYRARAREAATPDPDEETVPFEPDPKPAAEPEPVKRGRKNGNRPAEPERRD